MDHSCLSCGQDQAIGTGAICAKCLADKREFAETVSAARQANRGSGLVGSHYGFRLADPDCLKTNAQRASSPD
jgi:hypothetical protein